MLLRTRLYALMALLLTSGILSNCDTWKQGSLDTHSRPLVIGAFDKPKILNPILSTFGISSMLVDILFDGIVKIDENMIVRPGLAESWEVSDNGLVWTFHIRPGVTFHDGTPLTADDVKFTLDAIGNPLYNNQFSHIFASIKRVVVMDDHTIRFTLRHPFPSLPYYLYFGILPQRIYEGQDLRNTPLNFQPVGTGPYRLAQRPKDELLLEANSKYFLGKPRIHTIVVRVFKNQRAAWVGLMRGDVDFAWIMEPETLQIIKQLPHLRVYSYIHPYYYMIIFNHKKALFGDLSVRRALNFALDKERLIKEVLGGSGQLVSGLTYPKSTFNPKQNLAYPYDPSRASKLLKKSGWVDTDDDGILGKGMQKLQFNVYVVSESYVPEKIALFIQRQLADLGIQIQLIAVPLSELLERYIKEKQFDAIVWSFVAVGDPDINYLFWSSSQIKEGLNIANYNNRNVDRLLELGRTSTNISERINAYREFQRQIFQDPPGIFLFWRNLHIVLSESIRDVRVGPGAPFVSIHQWYFKPDGGM